MPKLRMTLPKEFSEFCSKHMLDWSAESIGEFIILHVGMAAKRLYLIC